MIYGYARVSTTGQTLEAQLEALQAAGAEKVFREKISGEKVDRPELARVLKALKPGDVLLVTRLDRLARSLIDLLNIVNTVAKSGASFRSMADGWADTTTAEGRVMLAVFGALAEFERHLIRTRTTEGRKRAKARGVKLGRKPKLTPDQSRQALTDLREGTATAADLARRYNVSRSLISRLAQNL